PTPNGIAIAVFALGVGGLTITALVRGGRRALTSSFAWLFWTGAVLFMLTLAGPDNLGTVSMLRPRMSFFAWVFLALWIAMRRWGPGIRQTIAVATFAFALLCWPAQIHWERLWNGPLDEVEQARTLVRSGATFIAVDLDAGTGDNAPRLNPLLHA